MFSGAYERQLDDRGRLALPANFRSHLGDRCMLFLGEDRCLGVRTADSFREEVSELNARVKRGEVSRDELRRITYTAVEVTPDKQGRIQIDARLRQQVGIEPQQGVVVGGAVDMLEIWSVEDYEQRFGYDGGASGATADAGAGR